MLEMDRDDANRDGDDDGYIEGEGYKGLIGFDSVAVVVDVDVDVELNIGSF